MMLKRWFLAFSLAACLGLMSVVAAHAADKPGSADHPLLPRYEGSDIVAYETQSFAQKAFATAPMKQSGGLDKNLDSAIRLEGALTSLTYRAPAQRTALEVYRNYETALSERGFTEIFSCAQAACGGRNFNHAMSPRHYYMGFGEYHAEQRYLLARLQRAEGDVYVGVYVVQNQAGGGVDRHRALAQVDVLALKPMEQRMVVLSADDLGNRLTTDGRVAIYGILFDTDKDTMRADSRAQLDEIAQLLKRSASLNVLVVGHTDAQGRLDYNQNLSERRARSVVEALTRDHGIDRGRLTPLGVGMAAPVATNRSDAGRAQNRRVELVERP